MNELKRTSPAASAASSAARPAQSRAASGRWARTASLVASLCLLAALTAQGKALRLFVLTGQSNSLGTPTTNTEATMVLPKVGGQPSEQFTNVPFFYDNTADGTLAGDAGLGDSGGAWTNICLQKGGYYAYSADHWGPEVGFARLLWDAGYRDFGIVKASRGGGGNSYWNKTNADHHMYDKVVNTVSNATRVLPAEFATSQVVCLLYVQGESNDSTEANEADVRFAMLLTNLQADLPNAAGMKAVFGQIASDASGNRLTTTQKQLALAAARPDIGFAQSAGLSVHNVDGLNVHYTADSLIVMGERMASEAMAIGALPEQPPPRQSSLYAWYSGDHGLVPTTSSSAARWDDLASGMTNRDLTQLTGSPALIHGIVPAGTSRNFLGFDGNDGIWATKANLGILSGDRTLLAAVRVRDGQPQGFLFDATSYSPGLTRAQVKTGYWHVGTAGATNTSYGPVPGTPTAPVTTNLWQVHAFIVTTNGGSPRFQHFIDGSAAGDVALATNGSLSGLMMGANVSQQYGIRADVAELLVYSSALTGSARSNVEAYLTARWSGVVEDTNAVPPSGLPRFIPVFTGGVDGYTCFRIPALVTSSRGTVIAVADGRIGGCGDIPTPLDLVCKRSLDNGKTWGPLQVIADYGSNTNDVDTYPYYGQTNIARVAAGDAALLLDRTNGRVWTLYDNGGVIGGSRKIKLEARYSDDDGATWSQAVDLEAQNPGLRPSAPEFLAGPGNGIQLAAGPNAGRLIFCAYAYGNPYYSTIIYSDDHGATWQRGGNAGTGGGEIQVAEAANGGLLASMRDNNFPGSGVRWFSQSADGGLSWGAPYTNTVNPPAIPDPSCQGNIYRLTTSNDSNASRLLQANAASASSRVNLTLRLSYDDGATWPVSNQVYAAGSAYSSVTKLATGDVGVFFEKDPYGSLDYTWRTMSQITAGADSLPPYTVWAGQHFSPAQLSDPAVSGPDADPDGDGYSNYAEFLAGTNPLDAASKLRLELKPGRTNAATLEFDAISNKSYTIQHGAALTPAAWSRYADVAPLPSNVVVQIAAPVTNEFDSFRLTTPQLP